MRYDRDDDMVITGKRHDLRIVYRAGVDDQGRILGLKHVRYLAEHPLDKIVEWFGAKLPTIQGISISKLDLNPSINLEMFGAGGLMRGGVVSGPSLVALRIDRLVDALQFRNRITLEGGATLGPEIAVRSDAAG